MKFKELAPTVKDLVLRLICDHYWDISHPLSDESLREIAELYVYSADGRIVGSTAQ
ncbi:hypothetical protein [Suicoccus acidiformans]|uniref:hypothetical protein n=1 Tax=Suicoccus acidiformans TaxID=2036206 RepID=UPI0013C375AB|nr:hypothetical protein [Suicoccus acidiformans]